ADSAATDPPPPHTTHQPERQARADPEPSSPPHSRRAGPIAPRPDRKKTIKPLLLSTIAAAALALSAGTALASENSPDNGFEIYLECDNDAQGPARQFLTTDTGYQGDYTGTEFGRRDSRH